VEIADELAMRQLTDLPVGLVRETHPGLDGTHLPHRDLGDAFLLAEIDDLAGRLVQDLALLTTRVRPHLGCAPQPPRGLS
jgi:hypothetical protein